ncbi:MAG: UDP-N-acetylglucosamine--N-acetylmuramyl-(pentapeptide) pyrophosphoryl-undecaprenol N-acetylglucosamine transferase [Deltaproteobacteria bacterium]|nr:UDP-N-acetylglucosamine--N-acetylmuramyl-(pentapeptide) pyrophosphoryl-undecaprenol N-acetylglucosamine transferase [Deltaproteobacteria bacterium]
MSGRPRILVAAGGTGGHVVPAATVAQEILSLAPGAEILFVGAGRPAEANVLDPLGFRRRVLRVPALAGRGPLGAARAVPGLVRAMVGAVSLVREFRPDLCLAFGGYVCGPVGLAAKMFGLPLAIHEQNSVPGLANRWLGRLADLAMAGFPEALAGLGPGRGLVVGNPVRGPIAALAGEARLVDGENPLILVVGGSQGSRRLNLAALDMAGRLLAAGARFRLLHQTGPEMEAEVREGYGRLGVQAEVLPFVQDMAGAYRRASLAISRAGALTLAELSAARLPAILVPLPSSAGGHQALNAGSLARAGLALVVPEEGLGSLAGTVGALLAEPGRLRAMSDGAGDLAAGAAAVGPRMAALVLGLIGGEGRGARDVP